MSAWPLQAALPVMAYSPKLQNIQAQVERSYPTSASADSKTLMSVTNFLSPAAHAVARGRGAKSSGPVLPVQQPRRRPAPLQPPAHRRHSAAP